MADKTSIEWTAGMDGRKGATWNPLVGCSVLSPGCTSCYAMKIAGRLEAMGSPIYWGLTTKTKAGYVWNGKVELSNYGQVIKPLSWRAPRRIFVNSMSDLFHESVPDEWIDKISAVMALCPQHTFQILTKRATRMRDYYNDPATYQRVLRAATPLRAKRPELCCIPISDPRHGSFWPHVWKGVSVEDQRRADERVPLLLETPAAVRFVSYEPALEEIHIERYLRRMVVRPCEELTDRMVEEGWSHPGGQGDHPGLDWVICGGESGSRARPFSIEWARLIIAQCREAQVPIFMKQVGRWAGEVKDGVWHNRLYAHKGGTMEDWPDDIRVREYPR